VVQCLPSKCKALSSNPQHKNISFLNYPFFLYLALCSYPSTTKKTGAERLC
jgi:hypothetical protein